VARAGHHVHAEGARARDHHSHRFQEERAVVDAERPRRGRSERFLERVEAGGAEAQVAQEADDVGGAVAEAGKGSGAVSSRGSEAK
jgi:hypothetical protein